MAMALWSVVFVIASLADTLHASVPAEEQAETIEQEYQTALDHATRATDTLDTSVQDFREMEHDDGRMDALAQSILVKAGHFTPTPADIQNLYNFERQAKAEMWSLRQHAKSAAAALHKQAKRGKKTEKAGLKRLHHMQLSSRQKGNADDDAGVRDWKWYEQDFKHDEWASKHLKDHIERLGDRGERSIDNIYLHIQMKFEQLRLQADQNAEAKRVAEHAKAEKPTDVLHGVAARPEEEADKETKRPAGDAKKPLEPSSETDVIHFVKWMHDDTVDPAQSTRGATLATTSPSDTGLRATVFLVGCFVLGSIVAGMHTYFRRSSDDGAPTYYLLA
jgi:hypothetical protein